MVAEPYRCGSWFALAFVLVGGRNSATVAMAARLVFAGFERIGDQNELC